MVTEEEANECVALPLSRHFERSSRILKVELAGRHSNVDVMSVTHEQVRDLVRYNPF